MASHDGPESVIRALRDEKRIQADRARLVEERQRQAREQERAAAYERAIVARAQLLAVAKYAAQQLLPGVAPDTLLESQQVVERPRRWWFSTSETLRETVATGWMVGRPTYVQDNYIPHVVCDPYTGEPPSGYVYQPPEPSYNGRILATNGELIYFWGTHQRDKATYTGHSSQFSIVPMLKSGPEPLEGMTAPPWATHVENWTGDSSVFSDGGIERAIAELVVHYLPEG